MQDCATILGADEPTVLPHVPLPESEYASSSVQAVSETPQAPMPAEWYSNLTISTRRGTKFMQKVLDMGTLSEAVVEQTTGRYLQFLGDVAADPETEIQIRVPDNLVDLVRCDCLFVVHLGAHG